MQPVTPKATPYDRTTILLHWMTAFLVIEQWLSAQIIDDFSGYWRIFVRSLHITLGIILALVLIARIVWRSSSGRRLAASDPPLLEAVAKATHWGLYLLMAVAVGLGMFYTWVRGDHVFGLFTLPAFDPGNKALRHQIGDLHGTIANIILIVAGIHAFAALFHHYIWRDRLLARMIPGLR
jgi:cytochrome b561